MNFLKTAYHELHANHWVATLRDTHELVCTHETLQQLDDCMVYMGLKDKVVYQKTWFRPMSQAIIEAQNES